MTTFNAFADPSSLPALPKLPALPVLGAVRKGVTLDDPFAEPEDSAPEQPAAPVRRPAADELDTYIAASRAKTPAAETTARRVPRSSIAELNQTDMDEIRSRFLTIHRDTRSPVATVLDLLDAPRNVVMSTLAPKLREKAEAEGNTGTGGLGRVNFSDVLKELGVTNRVAAGLLGFVGDVAFDPLTYVGPPGWGAQLTTKAGQGVARVGIRAAGSKAMKREIAGLAAGSARIGDDTARAYLAAKGFTPEALAAKAAAGATPKQLQSEMAKTVFGNPKRSIIETALRPLGGERTVEGGNLAADFFKSDAVDPASAAAKAFIEKYGEGTGKALRLGKARGSVGTQIAHIPFLSDYTVQMGRWTGGAKVNARNLAIAKSTAIGASDAVNGIVDPYLKASESINGVAEELTNTLQDLANEGAMSKELLKNLPPDPPAPPAGPTVPYEPPPNGPTPIVPDGLEIPADAPMSTGKRIVDTDNFPAARPTQSNIQFDVDARAQELLDGGEAAELDEAMDMARMEQAAAEREAVDGAVADVPPDVQSFLAGRTDAELRTIRLADEGGLSRLSETEQYAGLVDTLRKYPEAVQNEISRRPALNADIAAAPAKVPTKPRVSKPRVAKPVPVSNRARLMQEIADSPFGKSITPDKRDEFAIIMEARAKAWAREGPGRTPDDFWAMFKVGTGKDGKVVLYQPAKHGSPAMFGVDDDGNIVDPKAFSLEKIGTGEGAQAYSWGLYFAQEDRVTQHYRELGMRDLILDGKVIPKQGLRDEIERRLLEMSMTPETAFSEAKDVAHDLRYAHGWDIPTELIQKAEQRHHDRIVNAWYDDVRTQHRDLVDSFEELHGGTGGEPEYLYRTITGQISTGEPQFDQSLRSTIKAPIVPDSDPTVDVLRGLEMPPDKTQVVLKPEGGVRAMRQMNKADELELWDISSRMHWANGSTPEEKFANVQADLKRTVEVQSGWSARYQKDFAQRFGQEIPSPLTADEANELSDGVVDAVRSSLDDTDFDFVGSGDPNDYFTIDDGLEAVRRDMSYWDEPADGRDSLLADGSIRTEHITTMLKDRLGERRAAKVLASPAWIDVEARLARASVYHYWHEAQRIGQKAENQLDIIRRYKIKPFKERKPGAIYTVDLAPTDDQLIHWDKTLSEQPQVVQDAFRAEFPVTANWTVGKSGTTDGTHFLGWESPGGLAVIGRIDPGFAWSAHSGTSLPSDANRIGYFDTLEEAKEAVMARSHEAVDEYWGKIKAGDAQKRLEARYEEKEVMAGRPPTMGPKNTSMALRERGVRGVKFLDGFSRNDGNGSYNFVMYDDQDVTIKEVLFQPGKRASMSFEDDGTMVIRAFGKPDISSLVHEAGHGFLATLPTREQQIVARTYKLDPNALAARTPEQIAKMTPAQKRAWRTGHEKWATDFETYMKTGKAPVPELQSVFDKMRLWLLDIYKALIGTPADKNISPEIRGVMDRMLGAVDHGEGLATASGKMTRSTIRDEVKLLAGEYLQMNEATEAMRLARSLDLDLNDYGVGGTAALPDAADVVQTTFYHPDAPSEPVSVLRNKKFMSAVPAEWKDTIDGDRTLLQRVLVSSDPKRSRGSEEMLYLDAESILEAVGSDERKLLAAIKMGKSQNPRLAFYAEIYDAWPMGGRYGRKARVTNMSMVPAEALPIDTQFTINGRSAFVTVNEDGEKVVTLSGLDLFDTRASDLGSIPIDTGSTRAITVEEMDEIRALHGQAGYSGDAGEDIPLDPDATLYQPDVSGQEAMFRSASGTSMVGKIGNGESQGGLFGSASAPTPKPAPVSESDPVRMLNESDASYAERVKMYRKFEGATENTNTLFQDDVDAYLPDFPTPRGAEELRWTDREKELNAQLAEQTGRLKEMRKALHADLASFSADAAADNIENVNDLLRVGELLRETDAAIDQAAARMRTARMAKALDLDADDAAMRMEELGEEVYHLVANDPRAADLIADTAAAQMEAALARREALRSTLQAVANDDELEMAELAKALIGTDDEAVALAAFAPLGKYVGDKFAERKSAANIADRMESFWRRTFGVRRGTANQTMAQLSALNSTAAIAASNHAIARMRLKVADIGLPSSFSPHDGAQLLHAHAYKLRDPDRGNYFWWKIGPNGEDLGASDMLQVIKRAEAAGVYANPEMVKRLNETAQAFIDEMDELGRKGQESGILGLQVKAYMPKSANEVAQEAMTKHTRAGSPTPNTKGGGAWTQRFQKARTTDQVRFLAEDTLGAPKRWKQFFVGEVYLADVPDEALSPESKAIKDAVVEYFARADADPKWRLQNLPRATDPFELTALYNDPNQDRLKRLTGGMPLDELSETDLATVYGQRLGQDARARAMAQFAQFAEAQSLDVAPDQLALNGSNPSATIRLTGGTVAQPLGKVKTALGGESHAIRIGKEVYRQLDNSAWSKTDNIVSQMYGDLPGLKMERKMFPAALADRMEQFVQLASPERMPEMLQAAERITGMWKQMTLGFSPSWVAFNVIGNLFNGVAGGVSVKDFADVRQLRDIMAVRMAQHTPEKLEKMVVTLRTGQEMTGKELLDLATENRIINNALSTEQMAQLVKTDPGILAGADRVMRKLSSPGYKLNGIVEDVMKMTAFVSFLNQGNDVATAQAKTLRAMFDYSDFTKSEKQLFRTMFPFYSWMRSNLGYQIMLLGERPAYAALMPKLKVALEEAAAGEATVPENQRPSWMKNQLAAQVGSDPTGRFAVMLGNTLPSGDLFQALAPVVGVEGAMSFLHYFAGNINPLASVPLQLGTGTEFFSGRSIGPDDVTGDMSAFDLLKSQIRPVAEVGKLADAYKRGGVGQTAARALLGGRVQAFDQPRLDSSVRRELRDEEGKIRAAIGRANRRGDTEGSQQARARLLALYEDALKRGLDDAVPAWAEAQLAELASSPQ